ncbi:MAG: hypothetical protein IKQ62_06305 [Bacteroidaceae bacterium]|nr:hypothetical protein [Bacteroidaceae bacterium]
MRDDLSESISQRSNGEKDSENNRIKKISDDIARRCQLYEAESGDGKKHVSPLEIEQRVSEVYAKENHLWMPMSAVFDLGMPGPSGHENDTYVSGNNIFKVNNLLNSGGVIPLLERVILHNIIFPDTFYFFIGFTGYDGRSVMPVLRQDLIKDAIPATTVEIDTYMSAIGFTKCSSDGKYQNKDYIVWDVVPRNVLKDKEGDMYVVDAEIKCVS